MRVFPSSSLFPSPRSSLWHLPGGEEGVSLGTENTGFVLCGGQRWGRALAKMLPRGVETRVGTHLPGFAEEEAGGGGGVGWLAWRDPLSAPRFQLSEREESQRLIQAIGSMCVSSSRTRAINAEEERPYTKLKDG